MTERFWLAIAPVAVLACLAAGTWLWGAVVAPSYLWAIGLVTVWFVAVSAVAGKLTKGRGRLRAVTRATTVGASLLALAAFYVTSIRETTVDEQIVTAAAAAEPAAEPAKPTAEPAKPTADPAAGQPPPPPAAAPAGPVELRSGRVRSLAHSGRGRVAVVELPDGRRFLTLSDGFDIDPGPMVRVYLVPGTVRGDGDVVDELDLGGLKGSRGNQQYAIPRDANLGRLRTVVFWCVPFTQALAVADLRAAG